MVGVTHPSPLLPAVGNPSLVISLIIILKAAQLYDGDQQPEENGLGLKNRICNLCQIPDTDE